MRRIWEAKVPRKGFKATDNSVLCDKHFVAEDFVTMFFLGIFSPTVLNHGLGGTASYIRGELLQLGITIPASRKKDLCEVLGKNGVLNERNKINIPILQNEANKYDIE